MSDSVDVNGKTVLHTAAASGNADELIKLINNGADVNELDNNGTTALHFAAWENHYDCVKALLDSGADQAIAEGEGWTALHDAVRREYVDIISLLVGSIDNSLRTPEDYGLCGMDGDERFLKILKLLKENGVRLDSIGICGKGLLHDAGERNYTESESFLLNG